MSMWGNVRVLRLMNSGWVMVIFIVVLIFYNYVVVIRVVSVVSVVSGSVLCVDVINVFDVDGGFICLVICRRCLSEWLR